MGFVVGFGFEFHLNHLPVVWPEASCITSVDFSSLAWKMVYPNTSWQVVTEN